MKLFKKKVSLKLVSNSLYRCLIQDSCDWDPVETLHGGHGRLHGFFLPQVRHPDVMRQQVAVVLQPCLQERLGEKYEKYLSIWQIKAAVGA